MTTDQRDTSAIILTTTLVPTLLVLVVMTLIVAINFCFCKMVLTKNQNQLQQEHYDSVVGPPALPKGNANAPHKLGTHPTESTVDNQAENPACGMNITVMSDQGNRKNAIEQRDSNPECRDTTQLSPNTAYGTNVSVAPETGYELNVAYKQETYV